MEYAETTLRVIQSEDVEKIYCSNCEKHLLTTHQDIVSGPIAYFLRIQCPWCKDHSYDKPVYSKIRMIWPENINPAGLEDLPNNITYFKTKAKP